MGGIRISRVFSLNTTEYIFIAVHFSVNNILIEFRNLCFIFRCWPCPRFHLMLCMSERAHRRTNDFSFFAFEQTRVHFIQFTRNRKKECILHTNLYSLRLIFVTYYFHLTRSSRIINKHTRRQASKLRERT